MNQVSTIFLLLLAITVASGAKKNGYDDEAIKRGDSYIDKMLEDMLDNEDLDPYVLEDSSVGFSRKVMFVNVSGEAKFHDGYINGLSTLHRAEHCTLQEEGNKLRVTADLGAGELDFHYKGSVKFMNFGPTITITGHLSYIEVFMEFKVNKETGKEGKLTKFVIDDMRGMKVTVSGLGPLNWAVNPIISGVTKIFKRFVKNFMENRVEKHIRRHIPNYQFPVEGGETTEIPETIPTQPEETTSPETEVPEVTPEPETEAPEETPEPEPETEAPEETPEPEPETEAPEETPEPETEAPEETPEPETEAPEETPEPEPETEAPEETPEPETEAPEETPEPEPETEAPEETPEPETEAPEETPEPEPETEAPEETPEPEPETEAPEETPEPEPENPEPEPQPEENPDAEVNFPETPDSSVIGDSD